MTVCLTCCPPPASLSWFQGTSSFASGIFAPSYSHTRHDTHRLTLILLPGKRRVLCVPVCTCVQLESKSAAEERSHEDHGSRREAESVLLFDDDEEEEEEGIPGERNRRCSSSSPPFFAPSFPPSL